MLANSENVQSEINLPSRWYVSNHGVWCGLGQLDEKHLKILLLIFGPNHTVITKTSILTKVLQQNKIKMSFATWWWYYPTPSEGWGRVGTPRRPNSRATPQGLDHRSRMEREEPKIDLRRGSETGQSRKRWLRSCRGCPQALQAKFSLRLILWRYEDKRRLWPWQWRRESSQQIGRVSPKRLWGLGSLDGSGRCDISNCSIGNNRLWQRLGEEGMGLRQWAERHQLWQVNPLIHYRGDLRDRGPIGSSRWYCWRERRRRTKHSRETQAGDKRGLMKG